MAQVSHRIGEPQAKDSKPRRTTLKELQRTARNLSKQIRKKENRIRKMARAMIDIDVLAVKLRDLTQEDEVTVAQWLAEEHRSGRISLEHMSNVGIPPKRDRY